MIYDLRFTIYEPNPVQRGDAENAETCGEEIFPCVSSASSASLRLSVALCVERRFA